MGSGPKAQHATQALLLAGLAGVVLLSAFLLWSLRSGSSRGRGAPTPAGERVATGQLTTPSELLEPTPGEDAPARPVATERTALRPEETAAVAPTFDPGAITGRVLSDGAPVADVVLRLFAGALERRERTQPMAEAQSDAEGRFRFAGLVPFTRHVLHAQHPAYLPREDTLFPGHDQPVELQRAAEVRGVVRAREDGRPLAGIEIALERWHHGPGGASEHVSCVSDAEGRWQLSWVRPGIEPFLVLRPGFVPERREFQVTEAGGEGYEIWLEAGAAVQLELYALEDGTLLGDTEVLCDEAPVRTDARGRLALPLTAAGTAESSLRVSLALVGGCRTQGRIERAALQGVLRVPLVRGSSVAGRVLDANGLPVLDAQVRLSGGGRGAAGLEMPAGFWLNAPRGSARADADGRFTLVGLPPREGRFELRAQHPEHPPGRSEPFELAPMGQQREIDVTLERGATITGVVRVDGDPASARVYWDGSRASGWTRSNDLGTYRIAGVPSGEVSLRARLDGEDEDVARDEDVLLTVVEGEELALDLEVVTRRARITGRVVDTHGTPVAEANVVAVLSAELDRDPFEMEDEPRTESEADGSFELFVPDAVGLTFDVSARSGPRRSELRAVRAGRELEFVLPALAPVMLRVVDALEHQPVLGFQVYWRDSEEGSFERLVQGGRRFAPGPGDTFVAELPCGRLDLAVSARDHGFVSVRRDGIEVSEGLMRYEEFELELGLELELEFQVAPEHADALRSLQRGRFSLASDEQWAERRRGGAFFRDEVREAQALHLDENGVARLTAMASDGYRFFNAPRGFRFRPQTFDVPPVAHHRVKVVLEPEQKEKPRGSRD